MTNLPQVFEDPELYGGGRGPDGRRGAGSKSGSRCGWQGEGVVVGVSVTVDVGEAGTGVNVAVLVGRLVGTARIGRERLPGSW